jgi:hypothetical protein
MTGRKYSSITSLPSRFYVTRALLSLFPPLHDHLAYRAWC